MKELVFACLSFGLISTVQGQGLVDFSSGLATQNKITTNSVLLGPSTGLISGPVGSYYFALFVAPSTITTLNGPFDPTLSGFTFTGAIGTNTIAGVFSGGAVAVPGYASGTTASFTIVGWSANYGTTWPEAIAAINADEFGFWGNSGVAQVMLGGGVAPAGEIFGTGAGQIQGFSLNPGPIPEPATFALAGLGTAAILLFRRRHQSTG